LQNSEHEIRVLIVDDEQSIRIGCQRILKRMGCIVKDAACGEDGLEILKNEEVSIVLLDLKMPGIDGIEVLRRIKQMDENVMVIIMTGFATVETAIEAMKQGAYDFIPKPFEPDHVRLVVDRAREKIILRRETEKLEKERRRTLLDLGTEKSRIRSIIEALPNGVIVTNAEGKVVLMNPAFLRQLKLDPELKTGESIKNYIKDEGLCDLVMNISKGIDGSPEKIYTYEFSVPENKYFLARGRSVLGEYNEYLGAVIILINTTALKVLDQLKSEFVAKVSHELRSPLSTIHEQLALVLGEMAQEEQSEKEKHLLNRAKEKTQGLISLIGDLLDLSRIEAGSTGQEFREIKIEELIGSIVDFLNTRAKKKKQILILDKLPDKPIPKITADPMALESIFGNLITNAINYTQEGGEIHVKIEVYDDNICIYVIDNGFGIDSKYKEKIFDRFYRVKNEKTRYITGTGLGLPIVKGLVDSIKGKIEVDSTPGEGSTFKVILPLENLS